MASRSLSDLKGKAYAYAEHFVCTLDSWHLDHVVSCTYRSISEQDDLYRAGRTTSGKIVTNAKGGESFHNYGYAFDIYPLVGGKLVTDPKHPLWAMMGFCGEQHGLEWGGRWTGLICDKPHFQYTGGLTIPDFQSGRMPA